MQKIVTALWFDNNAEEAMNFYTSVFENSKIILTHRYPNEGLEGPMKGFEGKVLTGIFELERHRFMCLDGGPVFKFNPSVSMTVTCKDADEAKALWDKLSEGGSVLMPLQKYPFSEMYGWTSDKFGLSWQINVGENSQKITPSIMFTKGNFGKCEEAINNYVAIFKDSGIDVIAKYEPGEGDEEGKIKFSLFTLEGQKFIAMESSADHKFEPNGAVSFLVEVQTQEEVDYYWDKLTVGGNPQAQQCGWLADKYGITWQISPKRLGELMMDPDKEKVQRVTHAMLQMKKIDIAELEKAYNG